MLKYGESICTEAFSFEDTLSPLTSSGGIVPITRTSSFDPTWTSPETPCTQKQKQKSASVQRNE